MNRRHRCDREGVAIISALVCLALASVLVSVVVRAAVSQRQQARDEGRREQAGWLVESGFRRGAARLAADPDYPGETWRIGAEQFNGRDAAVVLIEVVVPAEAAEQRTVRVRAELPDDPVDRVRSSKTLVFRLGPRDVATAEGP